MSIVIEIRIKPKNDGSYETPDWLTISEIKLFKETFRVFGTKNFELNCFLSPYNYKNYCYAYRIPKYWDLKKKKFIGVQEIDI